MIKIKIPKQNVGFCALVKSIDFFDCNEVLQIKCLFLVEAVVYAAAKNAYTICCIEIGFVNNPMV